MYHHLGLGYIALDNSISFLPSSLLSSLFLLSSFLFSLLSSFSLSFLPFLPLSFPPLFSPSLLPFLPFFSPYFSLLPFFFLLLSLSLSSISLLNAGISPQASHMQSTWSTAEAHPNPTKSYFLRRQFGRGLLRGLRRKVLAHLSWLNQRAILNRSKKKKSLSFLSFSYHHFISLETELLFKFIKARLAC